MIFPPKQCWRLVHSHGSLGSMSTTSRTTTSGPRTRVQRSSSNWGLPFYVADDLEGNRWTIAAGRPTMG
jgi:hypothetical protein